MHLIPSQLSRLNSTLEGCISRLEDDLIIQYSNNLGRGRVVSVMLDTAITYLEFDMDVQEDFKLDLQNMEKETLYFIYGISGQLQYAWTNDSSARKEILELQTVILRSQLTDLNLYFAKNSEVRFAVISVERTCTVHSIAPQDVTLNQKLFRQMPTLDEIDFFEYHGTFNVQIRDQILKIRAVEEKGVIRKLQIKGIIHFVLALELMQYQRDITLESTLGTRLSKNELLRIRKVIDYIAKNPQFPHTISDLCRKHGLSAAKLQEGFKILEGCTVGNYIKAQRIELAEKLIREGDLNISEVVYSIGLTSRSYFSKIFKRRYQCTPKYYQSQCRNFASA